MGQKFRGVFQLRQNTRDIVEIEPTGTCLQMGGRPFLVQSLRNGTG
jgi:hypothetical protein